MAGGGRDNISIVDSGKYAGLHSPTNNVTFDLASIPLGTRAIIIPFELYLTKQGNGTLASISITSNFGYASNDGSGAISRNVGDIIYSDAKSWYSYEKVSNKRITVIKRLNLDSYKRNGVVGTIYVTIGTSYGFIDPSVDNGVYHNIMFITVS